MPNRSFNARSHILLLCILAVTGSGRAELPIPSAVWVTSGNASHSFVGQHLEVLQQSDRAILNWDSFNIGAGHSVNFDQPTADAVALNRIFQGEPSRILGALTADGQIYLINQNGFVFGEGARVNVASLVASTLDIDDALFNGVGITQAINSSNAAERAAFQAAGEMGGILIEPGAEIESAQGGRILILAPEVVNEGLISSPGGQAVLAAAHDKVYLAASDDDDLRGLLVEVGTGGTVTNLGEVIAQQGNVSLVGLAVNQMGVAKATTSVSLNGSVRLMARDGAQVLVRTGDNGLQATHSGTLVVGGDSVTAVELEDDGTTVADAQQQPQSVIDAMGADITIESGALIRAPGGRVDMVATLEPHSPMTSTQADNAASLRVESGAVIDVSGSRQAVTSVTRNVIEVEARANELADSPAQRDGVLRGETLLVDMRYGTPLLDISGVVDSVERGVHERNASGGTVSLASEGDLIVEQGAVIDISGGQVAYEGGVITTSKLLSQGQIIDIADADPYRTYEAVLNPLEVVHKKWGITETFGLFGPVGLDFGKFESGYIEGKDAGTLIIDGRRVAVAGQIVADTVSGRLQRHPWVELVAGAVRPFDQRPSPGEFVLDLATRNGAQMPEIILAGLDPVAVPPQGESVIAGDPLIVPRSVFEDSGLGIFSFTTLGSIRLDEGTTLDLMPNASIDLTAGIIDIDGEVIAPGGRLDFAAASNALFVAPAAVRLRLGPEALLDVAGFWINDSPTLRPNGPGVDPLTIGGGHVALTTGGNNSAGELVLEAGSVIDVSGGGWLTSKGGLVSGMAGTIELTAESASTARGRLVLGGQLIGYGLETGGGLSIEAPEIVIDSGAAPITLDDDTLVLTSSVWGAGFSEVTLTAGIDDLTVAAATQMQPVVTNLVLPAGFATLPGGVKLADVATSQVLLPLERQAFALSLTTSHEMADVVIEAGASVRLESGSVVSLTSHHSIFIDGVLSAPGGVITANLEPASEINFRPEQMVWLGPDGVLDVSGASRVVADDLGRRSGMVWGGGDVELTAQVGSIVLADGSLIAADGVVTTLDVAVSEDPFRGVQFAATPIYGDGGNIRLTAAEAMFLDGELSARAPQVAGGVASGGSLSLTLDATDRGITPLTAPSFDVGPRVIQVGTPTLPAPERGAAVATAAIGIAQLDPARVVDGGFHNLLLHSLYAEDAGAGPGSDESLAEIRFDGGVDLTLPGDLVLDAPVISHAGDSLEDVALAAAYVALGTSDTRTRLDGASVGIELEPSGGPASLTITAGWVDLVGDTVLQGFGGAGEPAIDIRSTGDVRLRGVRTETSTGTAAVDSLAAFDDYAGTLQAAGDVWIEAARIYPTTLSHFTIDVAVPGGSVVLGGAGATAAAVPPSIAGIVTLTADRIVQGTNLFAPLGFITLNAGKAVTLAPGSLTSVATTGLNLPFGESQFGEDLIFPLGSRTYVVSASDGKQIVLDAAAVTVAKGAVLDLSAGGMISATEFIPGPGGSLDLLGAAAEPGVFAIMPAFGDLLAPIDPLYFPGSGLGVGETITLAPNGLVAAGEYAKLPPIYALFGGVLVTPVSGDAGAIPGEVRFRADGAVIVAGKSGSAGNSAQAARWSSYLLEDSDRAALRAEYAVTPVDTYLASSGVSVAASAGSVSIIAGGALDLSGTLIANEISGRKARVDVSADALRVVSALTGSQDTVEVLADQLQGFGAASVLLGGVRSPSGDTVMVDVRSDRVEVGADVSLSVPEILLVAREQIVVAQGATLRGEGDQVLGGETLSLVGDSALARASTGAQVTLARSGFTGTAGSIVIESGGELFGARSITLDGTLDVQVAGTLRADAGEASFGASRVTLGDLDAVDSGLLLTNADLAGFASGDLRLRSGSTIDLVGSIGSDPVHFSSLILDAAALVGFGAESDTAQLQADHVVLRNSRQIEDVVEAHGEGALVLIGDVELTLEAGSVELAGFTTHRLSSAGTVRFAGSGALTATGEVRLDAPVITSADGVDYQLDIAGDLLFERSSDVIAESITPGLAGFITAQANSILVQTGVWLPSGILELHARGPDGAVRFATGGDVDLAGVTLFEGTEAVGGTPGGHLIARTESGQVVLEDAHIDVSGAGDADAGSVSVLAAREFVLSATDLQGQSAGGGGGSFLLEAQHLIGAEFSALNQVLGAGGFTDSMRLRLGSGDLLIAETDRVESREFEVILDSGALTVAGTIDASAPDGGRVVLSARDDVTVLGSAQIDASATAESPGGRIEMASLDGELTVESGARFDVAGMDENAADVDDGSIVLFAPRNGADDIAITSAAGDFVGTQRVDLVAVETYDRTVSGTVDAAFMNTVRDDIGILMGNAGTVVDRLGGDDRLHLVPGVAIVSEGDLVLTDEWNLAQWRDGGEVGVLQLAAGGDLILAEDLSDGFVQKDILDLFSGLLVSVEQVSDDRSWDLRLTSGWDSAGGSYQAVRGAGDLSIQSGVKVRTGTGDIQVTAAGDVVLDAGAALYTAGRDDGVGGIDDLDFFGLAFGDALIYSLMGGAQFTDGGGDLLLRAGGDVTGAWFGSSFGEWFARIGTSEFDAFGPLPSYWGVRFGGFADGIGALGGGGLTIETGGDLVDLQIALPSSGKSLDAVYDLNLFTFTTTGSVTEVTGGGTLEVGVGGDMLGTDILLGAGTGNITVAGDFAESATGQWAPYLALVDGQIAVQSRRDLTLGAVVNPTVLPPSDAQFPFPGLGLESYFFTWGDTAAVSLGSLVGDIRFETEPAESLLESQTGLKFDGTTTELTTIFPASLSAIAYTGDLLFNGTVVLYPSPVGQLELVAGGDLLSIAPDVVVSQSDADRKLLPGPANATSAIANAATRLRPDAQLLSNPLRYAAQPVHAGDTQPNLIVAQGDIAAADDGVAELRFDLTKLSHISAGGELRNLTIDIQHANKSGDVSVIQAAGLVQPSLRTTTGRFVGNDVRQISIGGTGRLDLLISSDIDLGTSNGIRSLGDTINPALSAEGADLNLLAGIGAGFDPAGFVTRYLADDPEAFEALFLPAELVTAALALDPDAIERLFPNPETAEAILTGKLDIGAAIEAVRTRFDGNASRHAELLQRYLQQFPLAAGEDDLSRFLSLAPQDQLPLILDVFFAELRGAGSEAAETGNGGDYDPGFEAIATLFPAQQYDGDLSLLLSQITTVDGGDINLLVPGGLVNAGVATTDVLSKDADELGIVVQRSGSIAAYLRDSFIVNQSRVFALDGGDITIWSSRGDIDAGRGAKTALAVPPPTVSFDTNGNLVVEFPPAIAGSGIRGAVSTPGREPGSVFLFAPAGVVNAGDAGIGSAGNVTIGATEVLGADNIDVGGASVGVPTTTVAGVDAGIASVGDSTTSATRSAQQSTRAAAQAAAMGDTAPTLSIITVEVLGFGEAS